MRKLILSALLSIIFSFSFAQYITQASLCRFEAKNIIDNEKGITLYEGHNALFGGNSVRKDEDGELAQGWVMDFYESGKVLHKGYYVNGMLKNYKNYYDNGQAERKFKVSNWRKGKVKTYYTTGKTRSKTTFYCSRIQKESAFYSNGKQKSVEGFSKYAPYCTLTKSFYENGQLKSAFQLTNKENMLYSKVDYYSNGIVKEEGMMKFDMGKNVYLKEGEWKSYSDKGLLLATRRYENGTLDPSLRSW